MGDLTVQHDYFKQEVQAWYDRAHELAVRRNMISHVTLPPLSDRVGTLAKMIPILNQADDDAYFNISLGVTASEHIAGLLAEAGKQYGLTEDEASQMAESCDTSD